MNSPLPGFVLKALTHFNDVVDEKEREAAERRQMDLELTEAKDKELMPIRMLLKYLSDMGLMVRNNAFQNPDAAPQELRVEEEPSSPSYAPGRSLRLDHPAILEIAIPNQSNQEKWGVVVINCAQKHPDSQLLHGPFRSIEAACDALAEFIAKNTVARKRRATSPLIGTAVTTDPSTVPGKTETA